MSPPTLNYPRVDREKKMSFSPLSAVLCAERVGQMTKTYNDIDAVTRLLEEVRLHRVTGITWLM